MGSANLWQHLRVDLNKCQNLPEEQMGTINDRQHENERLVSSFTFRKGVFLPAYSVSATAMLLRLLS